MKDINFVELIENYLSICDGYEFRKLCSKDCPYFDDDDCVLAGVLDGSK